MIVGLGARGSDKVMAVTVAAAMENKRRWRWAAAAAQDLTQRADILHSPISYSTTPKKACSFAACGYGGHSAFSRLLVGAADEVIRVCRNGVRSTQHKEVHDLFGAPLTPDCTFCTTKTAGRWVGKWLI